MTVLKLPPLVRESAEVVVKPVLKHVVLPTASRIAVNTMAAYKLGKDMNEHRKALMNLLRRDSNR